MAAWFRSYRLVWILGPVVWAALGLAGWIHAQVSGLPVLPLILTYDEWFAALLLLPVLATFGAAVRGPTRGGYDKPHRPALISVGYGVALVVFSLDLLVRALWGLGWEPFFLR